MQFEPGGLWIGLQLDEHATEGLVQVGVFLQELQQKNYTAHLTFLLRFLQISGLLPLVTGKPFLNPETGNFVEESAHHHFGENISAMWKRIITNTIPYSEIFPSVIRKEFLDSLMIYYHYHFTDFRTPQSLEILQQVFE